MCFAACCHQAQDAQLLGPANKHLPKLVASFVETLGRATDLVEEAVGLRMAGLLTAMGSSVQGMVEATYGSLKEKQQASFQSYMSGQVPK